MTTSRPGSPRKDTHPTPGPCWERSPRHTGGLVTWEGKHFRVDSARIWDCPDGGVPIAVAVSGEKSIQRFAPLGDHLVAVEPDPEPIKGWQDARGSRAEKFRTIGQIPICWGRDKESAIQRAHDQFRWFAGGWG